MSASEPSRKWQSQLPEGGNNIPATYLAKFLSPKPEQPDDVNPALARFLEEL